MAVEYPYVRSDIFVNANTYFYSTFGGRAFLEDWRFQRDSVLEKLPAAATTPPPALDAVSPNGNTASLIRAAVSALASRTSDQGMEIAERLLRKFEATRKLHRAYDGSFQPVDRDDFKEVALYLYFGEMLALGHEVLGDIRYLNALLKCSDILCSVYGQLDESGQSRLASLLLKERQWVDMLAAEKGIGM